MTQADIAMVVAAQAQFGCGVLPLQDDSLTYAGSATWDDWENHVPEVVRQAWTELSMQARLAVLLTAKHVTTYTARV